MRTRSDRQDWQVLDFLARLAVDRELGKRYPLMHYLRLFPGREEAVAREYLQLTVAGAGGGAVGERRRSARIPPPANDQESWVGPYRILGELGSGGQGLVYLAQDSRLSRQVALKVLRSSQKGQASLQRFLREAMLASRLDHPGICGVYDTGEEGELLYIAMRYVPGESLAARLQRACGETGNGDGGAARRLAVVALIETAARALHVAHEAGVIHRDIKPGNIMVTPEGEPVILDFGLARELESTALRLTLTGDVLGTPAYMSPEQLRPGTENVDRRADIWSLAVVLYECLTLERPFQAATREGLHQAICGARPLDPRRLNPEIGKDLATVLEVALDKEPARRYATARDLAEDLRRVQRLEPIRARPPGMPVRLRRWAQRNPGLAASLTVIFVFLVAALVYTDRERGIAVRRSEELRGLAQGLLSEVHEAIEDLPGATPANQQLAQRALAFLQMLADQPTGDPAGYRRNLVLAHLKVGDVMGNRQHSNLGRRDAAMRNYHAALVLARELHHQRPTDQAACVQLASCHLKLAQMHAQGMDTGAAIKAYHRGLELLPENSTERSVVTLRAELQLHLGHALVYGGESADRSAEAAVEVQRALRLVQRARQEDPVDVELRKLEARALASSGWIEYERGNTQKSNTSYHRARLLLEGLPEAKRVGLQVQLALAECYEGLARIERDNRHVEDALGLLATAVHTLDTLQVVDPKNELVLERLLQAHIATGNMYVSHDQLDEALSAFELARELADRSARQGAGWARERLVEACLGIGTVHYEGLDYQKAIEDFHAAHDLTEELLGQGTTNGWVQHQLARAETALGRTYVRALAPERGKVWLSKALTRLRQLAAKDPASVPYLSGQKMICQQLAEVEFQKGNYQQAAARYDEAVRIHRQRKQVGAAGDYSLGTLLLGRANCLYEAAVRAPASERVGRLGQVQKALEEVRDLFARLAKSFPEDPVLVRLAAQSSIDLGRVLHQVGGAAQALPAARRAVELMERVIGVVQRPVPQQQLVLCAGLILKSTVHQELAQETDARRALARAIDTLANMPPEHRRLGETWMVELKRLRRELGL